MSIANLVSPAVKKKITYPESDGKPMADNSKQFRYITMIEGNLEICFADNPLVLIAGDMLWYPVEGEPAVRTAPDVMVIFGRPKGDRGSYLQWLEGGVAPQVVFEVLSPGNRRQEMNDKFNFYDQYGVEEYYLYDPDRGRLQGWLRQDGELEPIVNMAGWKSPRLGIRFEMQGKELELYYPDGRRFLTYVELEQARQEAETRARAEAQARAEAEARVRELEAKLRQAGLL
jgi:Uma2 family endonuclease